LAFHSGREADQSPPCSAEFEEWVELYLHSTNTPSWRGAQLLRSQTLQFIFFPHKLENRFYTHAKQVPKVWFCIRLYRSGRYVET
jgi:hypothetical protein